MPGLVWFGLIIGALVTVGLIFTLQIRRTFRELLLAGLFSALIAFLLFLIWSFDSPFGRGISATASPSSTCSRGPAADPSPRTAAPPVGAEVPPSGVQDDPFAGPR